MFWYNSLIALTAVVFVNYASGMPAGGGDSTVKSNVEPTQEATNNGSPLVQNTVQYQDTKPVLVSKGGDAGTSAAPAGTPSIPVILGIPVVGNAPAPQGNTNSIATAVSNKKTTNVNKKTMANCNEGLNCLVNIKLK